MRVTIVIAENPKAPSSDAGKPSAGGGRTMPAFAGGPRAWRQKARESKALARRYAQCRISPRGSMHEKYRRESALGQWWPGGLPGPSRPSAQR